jgi:hypothetical protein
MTVTEGAVSAFLSTFGSLFLIFSSSSVDAFWGYQYSPVSVAIREIVGLLVASVGAGSLVYGVLSRNVSPDPQA